MKKYILILFVLLATSGFAQPIVNTVYGDTFKVANRDTTRPAEFVLKNATRNCLGCILVNISNGKTAFRSVGTIVTETDPIYTASSWYSTINNATNWNTAYGWGNHSGLYPLLSGSYSNPSWLSTLAWSKITSTPTTLAGYGITDGITSATVSSTYTPLARTITINGTTYDLSANRSWTVGTTYSTGRGLTTTSSTIFGLDTALSYTLTGNNIFSGRTYHSGNTGFGIAFPQNIFSASSLQYSTGTASQSGVTITGSGTSFTASMIGSQFIFANGTSAGYISNVTSTTSLTVSVSQTVSSQSFTINYQGLRGSSNNFSIGSPPSGGIGPFFKVGGFNVSNGFSITGSNLWPTFVAGFDASTNTDGDGSVGSYTNTSNSATSGAIRFIRVNPSGSVGSGWQLGELSTYGNYTSTTTFTDRSAAIRFYASQTHSSTAAGTYITFATTPNSTTSMAEAMRIQQSQNISIGTTTDVSNCEFKVASTSKTAHPFPNMTSAQRTALTMTSSNYGDMVYQTDGTEGVYVYKSTGWVFAY